MTSDQRFTLLISALGALFVIMSGILGVMWKTANRWGALNSQVVDTIKDVALIAANLDRHIQWHIDRHR